MGERNDVVEEVTVTLTTRPKGALITRVVGGPPPWAQPTPRTEARQTSSAGQRWWSDMIRDSEDIGGAEVFIAFTSVEREPKAVHVGA